MWLPMRMADDMAGSHCVPKRQALTIKKNLYLHKNPRKLALLAVLFEVIFRLIFQSKIFNYWVWVSFSSRHGS